MGNGSNLLVPDEGWSAFLSSRRGLERLPVGRRRLLGRRGRSPWPGWPSAPGSRGLTGLEFAHGIPGSVGGAVTMNAGAYGGEMAQVLDRVTALDRAGAQETVPADSAASGLPAAASSPTAGGLILGARFRLRARRPGGHPRPGWRSWPPGGRQSSPWSTPVPALCSSGRRATLPRR